jgi:hypothetical protein
MSTVGLHHNHLIVHVVKWLDLLYIRRILLVNLFGKVNNALILEIN